MTFKERLFLSVATWKWWQRYAVTTLFLFVCLFLWWMLSYRFIVRSMRYVKTQQENLQGQLVEQPIADALPAYDAGDQAIVRQLPSEALDVTFDKRKEKFFAIRSKAEAGDALFACCGKEQLQAENYFVVSEQQKDWYAQAEAQMVVEGKFKQTIQFFEQIQQYDNIILKHCEMSLAHTSAQTEPVIRSVCTFSIFLPLT